MIISLYISLQRQQNGKIYLCKHLCKNSITKKYPKTIEVIMNNLEHYKVRVTKKKKKKIFWIKYFLRRRKTDFFEPPTAPSSNFNQWIGA